jgi:hypothetical protein
LCGRLSDGADRGLRLGERLQLLGGGGLVEQLERLSKLVFLQLLVERAQLVLELVFVQLLEVVVFVELVALLELLELLELVRVQLEAALVHVRAPTGRGGDPLHRPRPDGHVVMPGPLTARWEMTATRWSESGARGLPCRS